MDRERIAVDGLQYENSAVGLAHQLRHCAGIISVDVDSSAGIAEIVYKRSRLTPDALRNLIVQCGYKLSPSAPATHEPLVPSL